MKRQTKKKNTIKAAVVVSTLPPIPGAMIEDVPLPFGDAGASVAVNGFNEPLAANERNAFPLPSAPPMIVPPKGVDAPKTQQRFVTPIQQARIEYAAKRREIVALHPGIEDDEECLNDTLDGETELVDLMAEDAEKVVTMLIDVAACKEKAKHYAERASRLEAMIDRKKELLANTMSVEKIANIKRPTITIRLQQGQQKVEFIGDVSQLAPELQNVKITPNLMMIKAALKANIAVTACDAKGVEVRDAKGHPTPIAHLVDGKPFIVIK